MKKLVLLILLPSLCMAWGKRGHDLVAKTAARILVKEEQKTYLRDHAFDLGYYSNVPDIIWRNMPEKIAKTEGPQHFLDWNKTFETHFEKPENIPVRFEDYKKKMGKDYDSKLGLVPWRIKDLFSDAISYASKPLDPKSQGKLLVTMGVLSHYSGDLGNPFHTTDNYDGQMTGQKGIHSYFETLLVDQLDLSTDEKVMELALEKYKKLKSENRDVDQNVRWLIGDSHKFLDEALKKDKEDDRKDVSASLKLHEKMLLDRLATASAVTALIWRDILAPVKNFDSKKFYFFDGRPEYRFPSYRF